MSVLNDCSRAILGLAFSSQPQLPTLIHSNKSTTLHDLDLIKTMMDEKLNRDGDTIHSPRWLKKNKHHPVTLLLDATFPFSYTRPGFKGSGLKGWWLS